MTQLTIFDLITETQKKKITQELIDIVLCRGSHFDGGKYRIYKYFLQPHNAKESASFLSNEYGVGGSSGPDGISISFDSKGIMLQDGYSDDAEQILLKWTQVAKRINELVASKKYMSADEIHKAEYKLRVSKFLRTQLEKGDLVEFPDERFVVENVVNDYIYVNCLDVDVSQSRYAFSVTLLNHTDCKILPYTFNHFPFKVYKTNGLVINSQNFMDGKFAA